VTQMPHCSAQYGQCVATVRSAMTTSSSKRHTTLDWRDRADFSLNSPVVPDERTLQRDALVGLASISNKIVVNGTALAPAAFAMRLVNLFLSSIRCDHCISLLCADER
jgi:hypothetical protein